MDPEAALKEAESSLKDGEIGDAFEKLSYYCEWRRKGGFEPTNGDARARRVKSTLISMIPLSGELG